MIWSEETLVESRSGAWGVETPNVLLRWLTDPKNEFTDGVDVWIEQPILGSKLNHIFVPGFQFAAPNERVSGLGETRSYEVAVGYWLLLLMFLGSSIVVRCFSGVWTEAAYHTKG